MGFVLFLLVAAAWGTLFIDLPRWLQALLTLGFLGIGLLMLIFGGFAYTWDSGMNNPNSRGGQVLFAGIMLLVSSALMVLRILTEGALFPGDD